MNSIQAILTDLDGVIRHWNSDYLHQKEMRFSLESGHLFSICFEKDLLSQVITGQISDSQWRDLVQAKLSNSIGISRSKELVDAWTNSTAQIDKTILEIYKTHFPNVKVFLSTNATTRLKQDLNNHGLDGMFEGIFNSSELGVAKPADAYFEEVMKRLRVRGEDIIYVDDSTTNVQAAKKLSLRSHHYQDHARLVEFLVNIENA